MTLITLIIAIAVYFIGFWIGKIYERSQIYQDSIGVMVKTNKETRDIESITLYYTHEAYEDDIARLKEEGVPCDDDAQE